ncbi:MAG TPA: type II 3-dehydroquinate dehydratase [Novosphingobium sp.]|nr:type II 3-dehydroquinate dehydratase [Novosphingobium sp.]
MASNLVYVLNGPNLNMLGTREPHIYGSDTLADVKTILDAKALDLDLAIAFHQSNHEGQIVDWLHEAHEKGARAVILNAGALTHTSIAIHDAIKAITVPVIEVHLSNPHAREAFRHTSYVAYAAKGTISGFGVTSYILALQAAANL